MTKEKKLKLNYFIWGQVDGESKSFYLNPKTLIVETEPVSA